MKKLKLFWKSRKTWSYAFIEWKILMHPHIHYGTRWVYDEIDEQENAFWFYESLNNYNNFFDDWGL